MVYYVYVVPPRSWCVDTHPRTQARAGAGSLRGCAVGGVACWALIMCTVHGDQVLRVID